MAIYSESNYRYFCVCKDVPGNIDTILTTGQMKYEKGVRYPLDIFPQDRLFLEQGGRSLKYYQLVYIIDGSGWFKNCNTRHDVRSGNLFIIRPGVWHSYAPSQDVGWTSYYVEFTGPILSGLIESMIPGIENDFAEIGISEEIMEVYEKILECASKGEGASQIELRSYVSLLITLIAASCDPSGREALSERDRINQAISYMEENISLPLDIPGVAESFGFSYSSFRRIFKAMTGVPPIGFLNNLRIQKAKHLLMTSDLLVKQIASQCGFSSVEYFCSAFIRSERKSPSEFRLSGRREG